MGTGVLALTLLFVAVNAVPSLRVQKGIYGEFQKKYGRKFATKAEETLRFEIFSKRLQEIEELNKLHKADGVRFGITKYTDWTDAERAKHVSKKMPVKAGRHPVFNLNKPALPTEFDWTTQGGVTSIKNENYENCDGSWAFASVAVVESQYLIKNKETLDLSEQQLIECDQESNGCADGWADTAFTEIAEKGIKLESEYPYIANDSKTCVDDTGSVKIKDIWAVANKSDSIATYIVDYGPAASYFGLPKGFWEYKSGVLNPTSDECYWENVIGYQSGAIVGFGEEGGLKYWLVKMSLGTAFGNKGYLKIVRGVNACMFEQFVVGATL